MSWISQQRLAVFGQCDARLGKMRTSFAFSFNPVLNPPTKMWATLRKPSQRQGTFVPSGSVSICLSGTRRSAINCAAPVPRTSSNVSSVSNCDEVYQKPSKKKETEPTAEPASVLDPALQELNENNVFFRQGGDKLDQQAQQKLDTIGQILNTSVLNTACLRLVGHSDATGPSGLNEQMGLKRANVVAAHLRPRLNEASRIQEVASDGETQLIQGIAPDNALHRRVTIFARKYPTP